MDITQRWVGWAPHLRALLRIVAAAVFIQAGSIKLFAFPMGMPPNGGTAPLLSQVGIGGILEVFGGFLVLIGLFTRPIAFLLSGMMAVAYFQFHFPQNFWPAINGGTPAILYCFIWLYFSAVDPGPWSVDAMRNRQHVLAV